MHCKNDEVWPPRVACPCGETLDDCYAVRTTHQITRSTYGRRRTVKKMFEWMFVDEDEGVQISVFAADESEAREALNRIPGRSPDAEYYLIGIKSGLAAPYVTG